MVISMPRFEAKRTQARAQDPVVNAESSIESNWRPTSQGWWRGALSVCLSRQGQGGNDSTYRDTPPSDADADHEWAGGCGVTWASEVQFQESIGNPIQGIVIPADQDTTATYAGGSWLMLLTQM
jgi:hypothetical protein